MKAREDEIGKRKMEQKEKHYANEKQSLLYVLIHTISDKVYYLARLHRKTLCYSKSVEMLAHSIRLLIHYLMFKDIPVPRPVIS